MYPDDSAGHDLVTEVEKARRDWQAAWRIFNEVPLDTAEVAVHLLNAAEARYCHLLRLAKREGAVAWTAPW
ncbi:MAG: DUF2508 family protein [Thermoanaerobacterales bacterium]|nr:DUF2508 family protein [Thermoanaerobacterales bacterium]